MFVIFLVKCLMLLLIFLWHFLLNGPNQLHPKFVFHFCNQMLSAFTNLFSPCGLIEQKHLFKLDLPFSSQNLNLITHLFCFICFQWLKLIGSKYVYHFCNQMLNAFTILFCPSVLIEQTHLFNLCLPCSS